MKIETVSPGLMLSECLSVVRRKENDRVFKETVGIEEIEKGAEAGVVVRDLGVVQAIQVSSEFDRRLHLAQNQTADSFVLSDHGIADFPCKLRNEWLGGGIGCMGVNRMDVKEEWFSAVRVDPIENLLIDVFRGAVSVGQKAEVVEATGKTEWRIHECVGRERGCCVPG